MNYLLLAALLGLITATPSTTHPAATQLKQSAIGEVYSSVSDPAHETSLWAVSSLGLFHSTDRGATWAKRSLGESLKDAVPQRIWAFGGPRRSLFVNTAQHGLYRSYDGGETWQVVSRGLPRSIGAAPMTPVLAMASSQANPNFIYCATEVDGVYRSEDGGDSWNAASTGLPVPLDHPTRPPLLAVDPADALWVYTLLLVPVHSHLNEATLFRSSNGGRTWVAIKELDEDTRYEALVIESPRRLRLTGLRGVMTITETVVDGLPELAQTAPNTATALSLPDWVAQTDRDTDGMAVIHDDGTLMVRSFNLDRKSLEFRPTQAGSYDVLTVPTTFQSAVGTGLDLGDDDSRSVNLPFSFSFYGQPHTSVFVNSNGNLTFGAADRDAIETSAKFFAGRPKIAPLWDDFNPSSGGGGVFVNSGADRVVVTWSQVPERGVTNSNTLQVVLSPHGTVQLNYNGVAAGDGLTGVSNGGRASGFFVNFSESSSLTGLSAAPIHELFSPVPLNVIAIARRFYQTHDDEYDALVAFGVSELPRNLAGPTSFAFHRPVRNDVRGIGRAVSDSSSDYGSGGQLQSFINQNSLVAYPADVNERMGTSPFNTLTLLGQEWGHRFLSFVRFRDAGTPSTALLGRDNSHWNYFFDSDASVVEGNDWRDNRDGSFTTTDDAQRYGQLDQYLMGLRTASEVGPLMLVTDPQPFFTGTIGSVISTFGRTNNSIRDPNRDFGARDRLIDFQLVIDGATSAPLTRENTAAISSSGRTEQSTDRNVVNTISDLRGQFGADAGKIYSIRKVPASRPRSRFFDPSTGKFTGENLVFRGARRDLSINDIIAQEGERNPPVSLTQTSFRHAFLLIVPRGKEALQADIGKLSNIRRAWEPFYNQITDGRGSVSTSLERIGVSQRTITLGTRAIRVFASQGRAAAVKVGYGRLETGSNLASGVAIFASRSGNEIVSEAAVAATGTVTGARFFAERTSSVNTGFAAASPSGAAALSLELRDTAGAVAATATVSITAGGQIARFVNELFPAFNFPPTFRGSVTVSSSAPVALVTLRTIVNQVGDFLITTLPVADLDAPPAAGPLYLPQVADNGGYVTEVLLVNPGSTPLTGTAEFRAPNGNPLETTVQGLAGGTIPYRLEPNGAEVLATTGGSEAVRTGYLVLRPDGAQPVPIAGAVFTFAQRGLLMAATGVSPAPLSTRVRLFVDRTAGHDTGVAVVNPSDQTASLQLTLANVGGGTGSPGRMTIRPRNHSARFFSEISPGTPVGFRGTLEVVSDVPVAVLALRSTISGDRFLLSTLPVDALDVDRTARVLYFPQIVDGGGFTTEFTLLNLAGGTSAARLTFFSQQGAPLGLILRSQ